MFHANALRLIFSHFWNNTKFLNFGIGHTQGSTLVLLQDLFLNVRTQYQVLKQFGLHFWVTTFIYF